MKIFNCNPAILKYAIILVCLSLSIAVNAQKRKPNIILIFSDDIGYAIPAVNGDPFYSTPNIDSMARNGINFTHCEATPLCAPSRMMILTGKYNFRNYSNWGFMNETEKTIGNVMQDAGYTTGFFGKLQLQYSTELMHNWGWDRNTVFEISADTIGYRRYKNPVLVQDGYRIPDSLTVGKYCDDILTQQIIDFADSNKAKPFLVYYSMSIGHTPFSPTPDDSAFAAWNPKKDTGNRAFFPSMVKYMDKKVGQILDSLKSKGLDQNTIVIFCGDNGTPSQVYDSGGSDDEGEKGSTTEGGTRVPLIIYWPGHIKAGATNTDLIDFTDFFPTFAEAGGITNLKKYNPIDGLSFYKRMLGNNDTSKHQLFMHYDAHPGLVHNSLERWVRDTTYKLYQATGAQRSGNFYNVQTDPGESKPITDDKLTNLEIQIKQNFQTILDSTATWPAAPGLTNKFVTNITDTTAIVGATIQSRGASLLIERGSNVTSQRLPTISNGRKIDDSLALGELSMKREGLLPQTKYKYSLYGINKNLANSTGYTTGVFYTLSSLPTAQATSFTAEAINCKVILKWQGVQFPKTYAKKAGYLLVYSTNTPAIVAQPNGHSPEEVVTDGTIIKISSTALPHLPVDSSVVKGLLPDSTYKFLLIPYTWNGLTDSTYNYLTQGALTTTRKKQNTKFVLTPSIDSALCFGSMNGVIFASASNGTQPYKYSFNGNTFDTVSVFNQLGAGDYKLAAKEATGCYDSTIVTISQPSKLSSLGISTNTSCNGGNDGLINLQANGGTAPYLYSFDQSNFDTVSHFHNLLAGNYTLISQDANHCADTIEVAVGQSSTPCLTNVTKIYPNPSKGDFNLYLSQDEAANLSSISIYNSYGRMIQQIQTNSSSLYKFGKTYASGGYVLRITFKNSRQEIKIIKL